MQTKPNRQETTANDSLGDEVRTWKISNDSPPLFIEAVSPALASLEGFIAWMKAKRSALDRLLLEHGGIVFRGFPVTDADSFGEVVGLFEQHDQGYAGGASLRPAIKGNVFESTRYSNELKIPLHQEMAYMRDYPGHIIFYCHKRAAEGGETIISDMRSFNAAIPESLKKKISDHGVLIVRNFAAPPADGVEVAEEHPDQRSWKNAFYTDDREQVIEICRQRGMEAIWHDDDTLTVRNFLDGFATHPVTGETIYRSTIHTRGGSYMKDSLSAVRWERVRQMYEKQKIKSDVTLGNGEPLTDEETKVLSDLFDKGELKWEWQEGDVMLLDNLLVAHGRNSFVGDRLTQVALLA